MDIQKFAEETFRSDARIRYLGVVDTRFDILSSHMREGVQSVTTDDQERNFVQIMAPIIIDAVEKLQPVLGNLDNVTLRYEKILLTLFRMEDLVVTLSFNADVSTPFISSLSESMRKLGSRYL